MQIEGWESEWWWWVGGGAGGVAQIMQQLHCNSPRAGLLLRASRLRAASEQRASAFAVAQGRPALIGRAGVALCAGCIEGLREGFGVKRGQEKRVSILAILLVTCREMMHIK